MTRLLTEYQDLFGRWARVEVDIEADCLTHASAEVSSLPLLASTLEEVLQAARGQSIAILLDWSARDVERCLPPSTQRRTDDVEFAVCALQHALREHAR